MVLLAVGDHIKAAWLVVLAMSAFILVFSACIAGTFWVLVSEVFSMSAKSPAASVATAMLFLAGQP